MKRLLVLTIVVFFALTGLCFGQNYVPGEVLLKWKDGVSFFSVQNTIQALGMSTKRNFRSLRIYHLKLGRGMKIETALANLRRNPNVEYAEPNYMYRALATPNDPQFTELWGLHNTGQTGGTSDADIDAPEAWDIHTGSHDVVIAVLDTGIDFDHPDIGNGLNSNIWTNDAELNGFPEFDDDGNGYEDDIHGWDFVGDDNDPTDYFHDVWGNAGHGTHVAGTIAAIGNNSTGITGVNWYASIMPLRILGSAGFTDTARVIDSILYAVDNGAKVINASWGGGDYSQALYDAISHANDNGCLFVAAAGNGGDDAVGDDNDAAPFYPASYDLPNIISVAATDHNDTLGDFSNFGATSVDVAAPGVQISSSVPTIGYDLEVKLFGENFDSGLGNWTSWGENNTWGISSVLSTSSPNSLADSPVGNYLDGTESYITYNTPYNLVDKFAYIDIQLRCNLQFLPNFDFLCIGGDLGGGDGFLPVYLLNMDGWYSGSTGGVFNNYIVDVSPLGDFTRSINIGFNLHSDASANDDGVYIDDVSLYTQDLLITGHDYASFDGTSMAAPHVSGLAGLILARYPTITLQKLKERILNTVDYLPSLQGKVLTGGRINAYKALDPTYSADLVVDLGSLGLWQYDGSSTWNRITLADAQHLAVYGSKLVGDFGSAGLWQFDGSLWTKLTPADADNTGNCMVAYGTSLVVDLGTLGLWQYDGSSTWNRITPADAQHLAVYGSKLVGDFGSAGLWEFDGSLWTKLTPADADNTGNCMVAYGTSLVVDLGSLGLWQYDGSSTWNRITPADAQHLAVYGGKLVGDFGGDGLWEFDGSLWTKLTPVDADNSGNCIVAYGTSLVVDLGTLGLWQYDGSSTWSRITPADAQHLAVYASKLVGDLGSAGLWEFDGSSWIKLTPADADNNSNCMVAVDFM
jgi:subtilisin family serine protease